MFAGADGGGQRLVGLRVVEQTHLELHPQDPPDGIVNSGLRHPAFLHQFTEQRDELHVRVVLTRSVRDHNHVQPGVDRSFNITPVIIGHFINGSPVRNEKTLESKFTLQHFGQKVLIPVHFPPIPTAIRHHD